MTASSPPLPRRNAGLDVVRASAILGVLASHYLGVVHPGWMDGLAGFLGGGGVHAFFALSGFLIGRILLAAAEEPTFDTWLTFMKRRWSRTLPLYAVVLLTIFILVPPEADQWKNLVRYATMTQGVWTSPETQWFAVSWSLAVEEGFYLLFGTAFLAAAAFFGSRRAIWPCLILFLLLPPLVRYVAFHQGWNIGTHAVLWSLDGIAWGVLVAVVQRHHKAIVDRYTGFLAVVGCILIWMAWHPFILGHATPFYGPLTLTMSCAGFAYLLPLAARLEDLGKAGWPIRQISLHSYGAYLIHLDLLISLHRMMGEGWTLLAVWLGLVAILSRLSFVFIEQPFMTRQAPHKSAVTACA
jgi:peptidoglycan/LPS O-acetylase OafA/YrhL